MSKYKDLLNSDVENKDFVVEAASITLQKTILDSKMKLDIAKKELITRKSTSDFKPEEIYKQHKAIRLIENELEYYQELQKELF